MNETSGTVQPLPSKVSHKPPHPRCSAFCGLSREHLAELVTELAPLWEARCEAGRRRRHRDDRLLVTPWPTCAPV